MASSATRRAAASYSFDDLLQDGEHGLPEDTSLSTTNRSTACSTNVSRRPWRMPSLLPERERLVLALYYDEELNLKEIARYWASANRGSASCTASAPRVCVRAWPIGGRPEPASTAACNR